MSPFALLASAFQWTLRNSLQAIPLMVLVLLIPKLLGRRLGARPHYVLGLLVFAGLLLPIAPSSSLSIWNLLYIPGLSGSNPVQNLSAGVTHDLADATAPEIERAHFPAETQFRSARLAALVWLTVAASLAGITVWRYRTWQQLVNRGHTIKERGALEELDRAKLSMRVKRNVALTAVKGLAGPAVFGFLKVHILLPKGLLDRLTLAELRLVLLHELAHVKRNDLLLSWASLGVQFLHWFNPLAWWTLQRFRADRELVCDAMVVASIEPGEQHSYCKVLVKIAEILWPGPEMFSTALSVVSSTSELKRRIIMIKSYQKPGITARVMTAALSVLLAGFTLTRARQTDHAANSHPLAPTSLALSIDAKGDIRLSDEKNVLTIDELRAVLRSNAVSNSELVLHLKADRNAPFDRVIKVVDTARDFQIAGISLATQSGPPERSGDSSNVVSKIDIKYVGPHLAEESQVRANIHVRLGDPFGPAAIDDDVRRLYGTGLFHDVRVAKKVEPEGTSLTYVVQCNPHISEISFSGNSSFSEAELSKLITARVNSPLRERVLFSDAEVIRDVYEKAGFNETVVKYSYELNAESALAKVTFRITENK